MPRLTRKERARQRRAKREAAEREKQRLDEERKKREAEVSRMFKRKMRFLQDSLPRVLENPWLTLQAVDVLISHEQSIGGCTWGGIPRGICPGHTELEVLSLPPYISVS
eukprot:513998-Amorphochlora_amoeboformis.AAC.2